MKCSLCGREVSKLEFHHFYPGKKRRKDESGIDVCEQCGLFFYFFTSLYQQNKQSYI